MKKALAWKGILAGLVVLGLGGFMFDRFYVYAPDVGQLGGPIEGLTPWQLKKFYETKKVFLKEFSPEEGLGPLFNGKSCFECHGQPGAVGGEGRDVASTGVVRIGQVRRDLNPRPEKDTIIDTATLANVDRMLFDGGPALERKSITSEFPDKYPEDCQIEIGTIPTEADFISMRHAPPVFGFGLIDAIPDGDITFNMFEELDKNPRMAGHTLSHMDPLANRLRVARFGWKNQNPNLIMFTGEALNVEMGITTDMFRHPKSAKGISDFPHCIIKYLPAEPNDNGKLLAQLTYFQSLLAPPPRGPITEKVKEGEKVFEKLGCAVCHKPEMRTASKVYVVDPDSPAPKANFIEVAALEDKPVRAFSDFLVHNMGKGLADGIPQNGANGGEWRTTPLWGLRFKKFLLHDGRTTSIKDAVLAHGGEATEAVDAFKQLSPKEQEALLAFLKSL